MRPQVGLREAKRRGEASESPSHKGASKCRQNGHPERGTRPPQTARGTGRHPPAWPGLQLAIRMDTFTESAPAKQGTVSVKSLGLRTWLNSPWQIAGQLDHSDVTMAFAGTGNSPGRMTRS